jgi:hypothetical protein
LTVTIKPTIHLGEISPFEFFATLFGRIHSAISGFERRCALSGARRRIANYTSEHTDGRKECGTVTAFGFQPGTHK